MKGEYEISGDEIRLCAIVFPFLMALLGSVGTIESSTEPHPYAWAMLFISITVILTAIFRAEKEKGE